MKKSLLAIAMVATVLGSTEARTLTPAEALARAGRSATSRAGTVNPVMTVGDTTPAAYIFSNGDNAGYIVLAANDIAAPVLGYSDNGNFDPTDVPANLRYWLGEYARQIAAGESEGVPAYSTVSRAERSAIAPMTKTRWDQSAPYDLYTPELNGEKTVTGCVATAMAQVMKYYNWPAKANANANFSYTWTAGAKNLSLNFANHTLDWANMLDTYETGHYSDAQAQAVATLMQACGYSVKMDYNVAAEGGSGATSFNAALAFVKYFDYDLSASFRQRKFYSLSEWEDMIYENLRTCGPVLYGGSGPTGGHEFVCDGYSSDGYFHFNWGWSGMSDGYFLLNALSPDAQGIGGVSSNYNSNQDILLGLKKNAGTSKSVPQFAIGTKLGVTKDSNTTFTLTGGFYSWSLSDQYVTLGVRVVREGASGEGSFVPLVSSPENLAPMYGWSDISFNASQAITSSGNFRIYPAFKIDGKIYDCLSTPDAPSYVNITRNGSNYTASVPTVGVLRCQNVKIDSKVYSGYSFKASYDAVWNGTSDLTHDICGVLLKLNGARRDAVAYTATFAQEFKANSAASTETFAVEWDKCTYADGIIPAGEYEFAMADFTSDGEIHLLSTPVKVTVVANPGSPVIALDNWSIENKDAVDPANIVIKAKVSCTKGIYTEGLNFYIYDSESNPAGYVSTDQLFISEGETQDVTSFNTVQYFDASSLTPGTKYTVYPSYYNGRFFDIFKGTEPIEITIAGASGINPVGADEVTNVKYYTISGSEVGADATGLVIKVETLYDGSTRVTKTIKR